MYRIVKKQVLNPTVTRMDIEAPLIAKKAGEKGPDSPIPSRRYFIVFTYRYK